MGVTGLWTVVQPCARPIKIETLHRKRLAVDASIWIYQFLKAVRDKEGNALRNSHVVGFFQRICKLLFIGIKPVFVFDGGAPALKRQTIVARKSRREGRRDDATRTAGKLLALQMQRRAEEEEQRRKDEAERRHSEEEEELPENLVYVDEIGMSRQERQQTRKFRKTDAYHLPDLDTSMTDLGQPNDPRVMSLAELEQYARQFDSAEEINVYDFSKIDFDGPFFQSLPASDRYNILNAARLRSRLRMGLSRDQLDTMFPDRMAFSRFQIDRVRERNELTQRLMHLNGMVDDSMFGVNGTGRVAGEKGREYVLVRNAGVEGGWALGVIGDKDEGERNKPIDVDNIEPLTPREEDEDEQWENDEDTFEDVPIEGLNRLPKLRNNTLSPTKKSNHATPRTRRVLYQPGQSHSVRVTRPERILPAQDSNSLFVSDKEEVENPEKGRNSLLSDLMHEDGTAHMQDEDDDLERAIALSYETEKGENKDDEEWEELFQQSRVEETNPFSTNTDKSVAQIANTSSRRFAPAPQVHADSDEDEIDLHSAMKRAHRSGGVNQFLGRLERPNFDHPNLERPKIVENPRAAEGSKPVAKFDGPLPFEKLDLGSSLLGKKKMQKLAEDSAGGFEKPEDKAKETASALAPPWFSADVQEGLAAQEARQAAQLTQAHQAEEQDEFDFHAVPSLAKQTSEVVIDVEAEKSKSPIYVDLVDGEFKQEGLREETESVSQERQAFTRRSPNPESDANPSNADSPEFASSISAIQTMGDVEGIHGKSTQTPNSSHSSGASCRSAIVGKSWHESDAGTLERTDSDEEEGHKVRQQTLSLVQQQMNAKSRSRSQSSSASFEEISVPAHVNETQPLSSVSVSDRITQDTLMPFSNEDETFTHGSDSDSQEYFSDPEDDDLLVQLATEAEEHARFASSLNHKTQRQNIEEYERELKSLRTQQKKDRRDADEVTQVMITECQQLLKFFGLPYITAPMEAEAQCAKLVDLGLVDGIVTDDSDIFLFGGTRVYKNMFNQAKFVECYLTADLEREFDLTRHRLIAIAHLLGSDYTEGLPGIGPVTALEILSEFSDLQTFKDWWSRVQTGAPPTLEDSASPFRRKFRKNSTKLFLPPAFPDARVEVAYLEPDVDQDPSEFVWGIPDLDALRGFLMATIGWSPERTDEVLVPVIRDMNRREQEGTQANITRFVTGGAGTGTIFAPRRRGEGKSRRMEVALEKLAESAKERREKHEERGDEDVPNSQMGRSGPSSHRRKGKRKGEVNGNTSLEQSEEHELAPARKARKRKI